MTPSMLVPLERGGDDADLRRVEVGRDLHEHRHLAAVLLAQLAAAGLQGGEQGVQRLVALQRAQVLRVRAGDVDGHVVGMRVHAGQADQVVVDGALDRRGGVLADVQAEDAAAAPERGRPRDVGQEGVEAVVVETQPVDQRVGRGQPEHARLRVAGLRLRGHRADLDEAEAHRAQAVDAAAVLVQAGRQADAVGEAQAGHRRPDRARATAPQVHCAGVFCSLAIAPSVSSCACSGSRPNRKGRVRAYGISGMGAIVSGRSSPIAVRPASIIGR